MGIIALLKKRSVVLAGHATSVALEPEFWAVLDRVAADRGLSQAGLLAWIDQTRGRRSLASACRLLALEIGASGSITGSTAGPGAE